MLTTEEIKNKFPIGTQFKCIKVINTSTLEEELWNKMVDRGIIHEVTGYVKTNYENEVTFITKIISYDSNYFNADEEYLQKNHLFVVRENRLNRLSIIKNINIYDLKSYPDVCPSCGSPAYKGLFEIDCSKKCKG